ncbi:hypothetical protein MNBD_ALPHA08-177 [hydrothermal vent metagenome]|uniref:Coenzyme F390 synthetase n=1 Tax=hydrothermal vent metagenome TaxID=652676 RepID=A0A3B0SFI4_9ZZZZ
MVDVPEHGDDWLREMVLQLERTEQASLTQHEAFQQNALLALVAHAIETVPAYKNRLKPLVRFDGSLDLAGWQDIPILERTEAVALGQELVSTNIPNEHLPIRDGATSGSTGQPLEIKLTQFHQTMWACITARYHRWHGFDYSKRLATIRSFSAGKAVWPEGSRQNSWGLQVLNSQTPGKYFLLNINTPVDQQIAWLRDVKPDYIQSFASNLRAIALGLKSDGGEPLNLAGVLSYAEMLSNDARIVIADGLGWGPKDCYSTLECGYLALQSPVSNNYLVQSEVSLVEILNEESLPCEQGETGRVVVTPLHNYAQPLIRYAIGDYAVVGKSDRSGLPFPVLSKIYGRSRNLFRFAGGRLVQPDFKTDTFQKYLNPKQWQVAQTGPTTLEVRIIPGGDPSLMDTESMSQYIRQLLGDDLAINYKLVSELTNPRTGKHEDYVCELV